VTLTVPYTHDFVFRLYVVSYDGANNRSVNPGVFEFYLNLTTGPLSRWKLDESGGAALADSVGGNTATLVGGTPGVAGRIDRALRLTGNGDHAATASRLLNEDPGALKIAVDVES
jgi:hypothetical protein